MYGHVKTLAEAEKKGIEAAGGSATLFQLPETLPAEVLAKMHAPPKDESIKTLEDPKELGKQWHINVFHSIANVCTTEAFDGYLFGIPTRYGNMPAQWKVSPQPLSSPNAHPKAKKHRLSGTRPVANGKPVASLENTQVSSSPPLP